LYILVEVFQGEMSIEKQKKRKISIKMVAYVSTCLKEKKLNKQKENEL
jgi:hypothetical protein